MSEQWNLSDEQKERIRTASEVCSNTKKVLETIFPEAFPQPKTSHVGDHFFVEEKSGVYVLCRTGLPGTTKPTMRLINIDTGEKLQDHPVSYEFEKGYRAYKKGIGVIICEATRKQLIPAVKTETGFYDVKKD